LIGILGGTFDPIHLGHLHAARSVCNQLGLARVHLLLSARPGHRDVPVASMADRWEMLKLACDEDARLIPDDRELRRAERIGRPSWTVETLEDLRAERPLEPIAWIIGSDALIGLDTWHRWTELTGLAHLIVLRRPGAQLPTSGPVAGLLDASRAGADDPAFREAPRGAVVVLDLPMLSVSATDVRAALASGGAVDDLLPRSVSAYIDQHQLYGVRSDTGSTA
jgi:nicotinate-nucleotide adenylyltransferase